MDITAVKELTINEYRTILKSIKDVYQYDFNDFTLISLKRRIERFIYLNRFATIDSLIAKLQNDIEYFHYFMKEVLVGSTEMFRDPSFWRFLRNEILPQLLLHKSKPIVCFPNCVSGDELYTFCIILKENNWINKFHINAVYFNELILNDIKKGKIELTKYETSADNYQRYQGNTNFSNYFKKIGDHIFRDPSLISTVNFFKQNITFDFLPEKNDLIIFRNNLIYYSQPMHDRILKNSYKNLNENGYLAIGIKEQIGNICQTLFKVVNEQENIYTKNLVNGV